MLTPNLSNATKKFLTSTIRFFKIKKSFLSFKSKAIDSFPSI